MVPRHASVGGLQWFAVTYCQQCVSTYQVYVSVRTQSRAMQLLNYRNKFQCVWTFIKVYASEEIETHLFYIATLNLTLVSSGKGQPEYQGPWSS